LPQTTPSGISDLHSSRPREAQARSDRHPEFNNMSVNVLVVDIHAELYRDRLQAEFPDLQFRVFHNAAEVSGDLSEIDVMIMFGIEIRDPMLRDARRLKWIQSLATGVDHFLRCPSLRPEVLITGGRGVHGVPMREHVLYLMLAMSHDARRQVEDSRRHVWQRRLWTTLYGKTAAIAGTGIVGAAIGELLQRLGMHVIGVSRTPRKTVGFHEMDSLDRLQHVASKADYLINVLPASPENAALFDAALFAAMKSTAYYISAGRGQTVDETALISALRERRIAGAALDVFQSEPLPPDSPFWNLPNVFITPHVGGYIAEYEDFIMPLIVDNMRLFLAGRKSEMANIVSR
jgi:D-2-hydroxyacid dehydrogenase (NADP+)